MTGSRISPCRVCGISRNANVSRERLAGRVGLCHACHSPALLTDLEWMNDAKCAGADLDIFFDEHRIRSGEWQAYCHNCPVRSECLKHAQRTKEAHGIFGGMTPEQRSGKVRIKKRVDGWHVVAEDQSATAGSFATAIKFASTLHRKDEA